MLPAFLVARQGARLAGSLAARLAHLSPPRRSGQGGTRPLDLEVRLDAVAAAILDDLRRWLAEMARSGQAVCPDGLAIRVQRPRGGPTRRCRRTPSGTPTPPRAWPSRASTATCCGWTAAGRAAAMSTHWWRCRGWMGYGTTSRWSACWIRVPGLAKPREHWHTPVGDRRTIDRLTTPSGPTTVCRQGCALVEQAIAHLAGAWALHRRRGLRYRVRDVYRTAGALICLGRWLHRVPA
jgi:hypothetical protein